MGLIQVDVVGTARAARARLGAMLITLWAVLLMVAPAAGGSGQEFSEPGLEALQAGSQAFREGRVAEALDLWANADTAYKRAGDAAGRAEALLRQAEAFQLLGRSESALQALLQCRRVLLPDESGPQSDSGAEVCRSLARADHATPQLAILAGSLGRACGALGRPEQALELLRQSLVIAQRLGQDDILAASHLEYGNLELGQGDVTTALTSFSRSFELADGLGDPELSAAAAINAAKAELQAVKAMQENRGRRLPDEKALHEAERWLRLAADQIGASPWRRGKAQLLVAQAATLLEVHELSADRSAERSAEIRSSLRLAMQLAGQEPGGQEGSLGGATDWRALSFSYGYLGQLDELDGRPDRALDRTQDALFAAQQLDDPSLLYRWYWQTGRILRDMRQPDRAITAYKRAREQLDKVRPDLLAAFGGYGATFRDAVSPVYLEYADLLLQRARRSADEQARQADLRAAREAIEQLKAAELEDYFRDDCVASLEAKVTGIDQLSPDAAALYPVLLEDRTELILSLRGELKQWTVPITRAELRALAAEFVDQVKRRRGPQYLTSARALYRYLVEPFAAELSEAGVTTLIIVPDGPLRTVPLAALHDGERFLIERYAVAVTPSLKLLDPRPISRERAVLLLGALTEDVQGFEPLEHVSVEIEGIQSILETDPLLDEDFQEASIKDELNRTPYTLVHLATHGKFEQDPKDSFLLTYDGRLTMDELEQLVKYSEFRENAVELLSLSACETAAGDERAALGLAGVGVKAGARSVFASLWRVEDRSAARLVIAFYERLRDPSTSKAEALQAAQLELLNDRSHRHPGLWAPFVLIGNWL